MIKHRPSKTHWVFRTKIDKIMQFDTIQARIKKMFLSSIWQLPLHHNNVAALCNCWIYRYASIPSLTEANSSSVRPLNKASHSKCLSGSPSQLRHLTTDLCRSHLKIYLCLNTLLSGSQLHARQQLQWEGSPRHFNAHLARHRAISSPASMRRFIVFNAKSLWG